METKVRTKAETTPKYNVTKLFVLLWGVLKRDTTNADDALLVSEISERMTKILDKELEQVDVLVADAQMLTNDAIERNLRRQLHAIVHVENSKVYSRFLTEEMGGRILEVAGTRGKRYYFQHLSD